LAPDVAGVAGAASSSLVRVSKTMQECTKVRIWEAMKGEADNTTNGRIFQESIHDAPAPGCERVVLSSNKCDHTSSPTPFDVVRAVTAQIRIPFFESV
jgi:hypothetical protein